MSNPQITEEWLLANAPFVSFVCDKDPPYAMRFVQTGGGEAFGHKIADLVQDRHYLADSMTHPDDRKIIAVNAAHAAVGGAPVVSRFRLVPSAGELVPVLLITRGVLGTDGRSQGLAGVLIDARSSPALQGPYGLLSKAQTLKTRRPAMNRATTVDARWAAQQSPLVTFFIQNDENYSMCAGSGAIEEVLGYTAEDFRDPKRYKAYSAAHPADLPVADAYIEAAATRVGALAPARLRLVNSDGELVPVLILARGAMPPGFAAVGVAGGLLDISCVPALQGPFGLLATG